MTRKIRVGGFPYPEFIRISEEETLYYPASPGIRFHFPGSGFSADDWKDCKFFHLTFHFQALQYQ